MHPRMDMSMVGIGIVLLPMSTRMLPIRTTDAVFNLSVGHKSQSNKNAG